MSIYQRWQKFNEALAVRIVIAVATMECVYAFAAFVLVPFFLPSTESLVQYISSSLLQLIFLPLIMVGQEVLSRKERRQREFDHEMLINEMSLLRDIHAAIIENKDITNAA